MQCVILFYLNAQQTLGQIINIHTCSLAQIPTMPVMVSHSKHIHLHISIDR